MRMTKETETRLVEMIQGIFDELPSFNGTSHCDVNINSDGDIILVFAEPVKRELICLFDKSYIPLWKRIVGLLKRI